MKGTEFTETGYGTMRLAAVGDATMTRDKQFAVLKATIPTDGRKVHWNGGLFYSSPTNKNANLDLIREYFEKYPQDKEKVFLSIKGGAYFGANGPAIDGSAEYLEENVNRAIDLLGDKFLDQFCIARVDHDNFEQGIKKVGEFIDAGKIGSWCLSECNAETFKTAHAIYPMAAVEIELSIWERHAVSNGLCKAVAETGVDLIAYSPLGGGFLTGQFKSAADIPEGDFRAIFDRFSDENMAKNYAVVQKLQSVADKHNATSSQIALEWLRLHSGKDGFPRIIPIPGSNSVARVQENNQRINLSSEEIADIDQYIQNFDIAGLRYNSMLKKFLEQ